MGCRCSFEPRIGRSLRFLWYIWANTWQVLGEEDAAALAAGLWLHDERLEVASAVILVVVSPEQR